MAQWRNGATVMVKGIPRRRRAGQKIFEAPEAVSNLWDRWL
jgi:hypothetical protein